MIGSGGLVVLELFKKKGQDSTTKPCDCETSALAERSPIFCPEEFESYTRNKEHTSPFGSFFAVRWLRELRVVFAVYTRVVEWGCHTRGACVVFDRIPRKFPCANRSSRFPLRYAVPLSRKRSSSPGAVVGVCGPASMSNITHSKVNIHVCSDCVSGSVLWAVKSACTLLHWYSLNDEHVRIFCTYLDLRCWNCRTKCKMRICFWLFCVLPAKIVIHPPVILLWRGARQQHLVLLVVSLTAMSTSSLWPVGV